MIEDGGINSGIDVDGSGVGTGELCVLKIDDLQMFPFFIDLQVMTLISISQGDHWSCAKFGRFLVDDLPFSFLLPPPSLGTLIQPS